MPSASGNRSLLALAATGTAVGIALSVSGSHGLGAWITIGALGLLVYALHRLGRTGADAPVSGSASSDGEDRS